jgi:hypothetical protein
MAAAFGVAWVLFVLRGDPWIPLPAALARSRRSP